MSGTVAKALDSRSKNCFDRETCEGSKNELGKKCA